MGKNWEIVKEIVNLQPYFSSTIDKVASSLRHNILKITHKITQNLTYKTNKFTKDRRCGIPNTIVSSISTWLTNLRLKTYL